MKLRSAFPHLVFFGLALVMLALAKLHWSLYKSLLQEDGWAEWATFLAFGIAGVLALIRALRGKQWGLQRLALFGLAAFCLFAAGEEISWGQRLLGFRPPDYFLEKNYQQEANLHNLLKTILDTRWIMFGIAALYGLALPIAAHHYTRRIPRALYPSLSLAPGFAVVAMLEYSYPHELAGELAELLLGLLFVFDVALRSTPDDRTASDRTVGWAYAAALVGGIVVMMATNAVLTANSGPAVAVARQELNALAKRLEQHDALRDRLFRKQRVHKRVYTAVKAKYLALEPDRYYLDPWNQPYWFAFESRKKGSREGRMLVYSFGPDRRRDSELDRLGSDQSALQGDDVGVFVDLPVLERAQR